MVGDKKKRQKNQFLDFKCNPYPGDPKGKIIYWEIDTLKFYNVTESLIEDTKIFCAPVEEICIFPERICCQDHGGYLFTPRNEKENANVLEELKPFM